MADSKLQLLYKKIVASGLPLGDDVGTVDGLVRKIELLKEVCPPDVFESKTKLILGVIRACIKNCLRHKFLHAIGSNDGEQANIYYNLLLQVSSPTTDNTFKLVDQMQSSQIIRLNSQSRSSQSNSIAEANNYSCTRLSKVMEIDERTNAAEDAHRSHDTKSAASVLPEESTDKLLRVVKPPTGKKNVATKYSYFSKVNSCIKDADNDYNSDDSDNVFKPSSKKVFKKNPLLKDDNELLSNKNVETKRKNEEKCHDEYSDTSSPQPSTSRDYLRCRELMREQVSSDSESDCKRSNYHRSNRNYLRGRKRCSKKIYDSDEMKENINVKSIKSKKVKVSSDSEVTYNSSSSGETDLSEFEHDTVKKRKYKKFSAYGKNGAPIKSGYNKSISRRRRCQSSSSSFSSPCRTSHSSKYKISAHSDSEVGESLSKNSAEIQKKKKLKPSNQTLQKEPRKQLQKKDNSKQCPEVPNVVKISSTSRTNKVKKRPEDQSQEASSVLKGTPDPQLTYKSKSVSKGSKSNIVTKSSTVAGLAKTDENVKDKKTKSSGTQSKKMSAVSKKTSKAATKESPAATSKSKNKKCPTTKSKKKPAPKDKVLPVNKKNKNSSLVDGNSKKSEPSLAGGKKKPVGVNAKEKKTLKDKEVSGNKKEEHNDKSAVKEETNRAVDTDNKIEKSDSSFLSSQYSFESEPELGTLSTCLHSIKRKLPLQLGTATPPLKIFLSTHSDIQSEEYSDNDSSFSKVPMKLDDKNVVKRMAKANKPKEGKDLQVGKCPKTNSTPETLRKMMKLKKTTEKDPDTEFECSSFSDD